MEPGQAKSMMKKLIDQAKNIDKIKVGPNDKYKIIAEQSDAFVDIWYYSLNACAKKGINLSKIFNIVHQANMNKKDPKTGKFIKRDDGKILKPKGWKPPNVEQEILNQQKYGAF